MMVGFNPWICAGAGALVMIALIGSLLFQNDKEAKADPDNCDLNFYEIRDGKCRHAQVVRGKIYCESPKCSENKRSGNEGKR